VFEDLLYQTLRQPGAQSSQQTQLPTGLQLGTGVKPVASERVFSQGNLQKTDNTLDVAVNGQGFFQVTMPDGTLSYTRDGSFHLDAQGQLVSSSGYPLSPAITIPSNAQVITIARDGTVTVTQPNQVTPTQVGAIMCPQQLKRGRSADPDQEWRHESPDPVSRSGDRDDPRGRVRCRRRAR
jgi:flagellar basal-body rod protein FlgG